MKARKTGKKTPASKRIPARISKTDYYLEIAQKVASRSTCLRRNYGAVIVNNDQIIATGYNGAPRGTRNCIDLGLCYREALGVKRGERYELCRGIHAEQNAIIHASRFEMMGGTLYVVGVEHATGKVVEDAECCRMCKRAIINSGIARVVIRTGNRGVVEYPVDGWVRENLGELVRKGGMLVPRMVAGY
jgi:dCMP deaminase